MFQGTPKVASGEYARSRCQAMADMQMLSPGMITPLIMSASPRNILPLMMQMEADRMLNLAPTEQNFLK